MYAAAPVTRAPQAKRAPDPAPPVAARHASPPVEDSAANAFATASGARLQRQLAIGPADDPPEREADSAADTVLRSPDPGAGRCACGGTPGPDGECAACKAKRLNLSRATPGPTRSTAPPIVDQVLAAPGRPLDARTRSYFEPRFGTDFSAVRVHDDAPAAASARAVDAHAYTVGSDIVFSAQRHSPGTAAGDRLLAHELAHVRQTAGARSRRLHRQGPVTPQAGPARTALLAALLRQIDAETASALSLRSQVDALPLQSSARRTQLEGDLDRTRRSLLEHLEERINALQDEIEDINRRLGPAPQSVAGRPDLDALGLDLVSRERELAEHEAQARPLRRWRTRQQIESLQAQIAAIDAEIATLPQVSDPRHPRAAILALRRDRLEQDRRRLAASLTTTATGYKQADPRWGQRRYGQAASCTNVAEAGCGPTSLAILLNYLFQEDPETAAGPNRIELVTPVQTASYAETNGRVCNNGTTGDTMVTNVSTAWPGFRGLKITLDQATTTLRSGNLVIFLCHSCSGTTAGGGTYAYGGHFMVLNSVDSQAQRFGVIDPAGANVVSISRAELAAHSWGFWTVERK